MAVNKVILYYDADCILCSRSVRFIILHDKREVFLFSALNSLHAQSKGISGDETEYRNSLVLEDGNHMLTRSDAVIRVFNLLGGWFRVLSIFRFIPRPARDAVYDWIARNRYSWFGRSANCLRAGPGKKNLFLE